MTQTNFKKLLPFLSLVFFSCPSFAQEITIVKQLNTIIRQVKTLKADSSFEDINFLTEVIKNKEIVSLGEATHGTREIFTYKDRLVRYLVSNLNFKSIVFEADNTAMENIDNYINGKVDTSVISPNYKGLFKWLKAYNKAIKEEDRVHIYGLEIREFNPAINKILALNKDISQEDKDIFLEIKNTAFDKIDKKQLAKFRVACTHLPENLHGKMLIQLIDNYYRFIGKTRDKIGFRDGFMAENAIALKQSTGNKKMIIWAHNGHVAKTSLYNQPAMGEYLEKTFGDKYYVIATDINKGNVSVRKFIAKNRPASDWQSLYYPEVDSNKAYEYYFKQCKYKNFILDVQAAMANDQLKLFLTEPKEMRMIGGLSVPVNKKLSIAKNFDMVVYFDQTNSL